MYSTDEVRGSQSDFVIAVYCLYNKSCIWQNQIATENALYVYI